MIILDGFIWGLDDLISLSLQEESPQQWALVIRSRFLKTIQCFDTFLENWWVRCWSRMCPCGSAVLGVISNAPQSCRVCLSSWSWW